MCVCVCVCKICMREHVYETNSISPPWRKKKAGRPSATCSRVSSLSFVEVRLVVIHHAFYPHCEAIVHRTSHPVLVPMTSAMGIFTRESLIPPWESSLHKLKIRYTNVLCVLVIRLDYIFRSRDTTRSFVSLCGNRWGGGKSLAKIIVAKFSFNRFLNKTQNLIKNLSLFVLKIFQKRHII